jgi:hypothetical protein
MSKSKIRLAQGTIIRIIDPVILKDLRKFSARKLTETSWQSVGNVQGNKRIAECATNIEEIEARFEERCSVEGSEYWF